jgi:VIT1/CCC1 family predicted Fe2+/Mn2+ transporter
VPSSRIMPMGLATLGQAKAPANGEPARDLGKAKAAFDLRDPEASKAVHAVNALVPKNNETHPSMGGYIKSIVFGGLDGIITTFAVVAGAAGGGFGPDVVIVMGISSLLADALSMGVGDALSSKAEAEVAKRERDREKWELENFKEGEISEMVEIYKGKGMAEEDAELVMRVCAKYEDLFVDMMLVDELGINPPDDDDSWTPFVKEGFVTFCSFCLFGFFPLAAYCIVGTASEDVDSRALFIISCVITCVMLFALGAIKSTVTTRSWWISGLEVLALGSFVALIAFGIGVFIDEVIFSTSTSQGGLH